METEKNYYNPNANYFTSGATFNTALPTVPQTITSESLGNTPSLQLPEQKSLPQAENLANYSLADIQAEPTTPSPAETQQKSYLDRIKSLFTTTQEKSAEQQALEQTAGIPDFTKQLTEATNRFRTTTAEQNQLIQEAGVIPLQLQAQAEGRGITAGGLRPMETGRLRENAIKQYTVTSKGLFQQAEIANLRDDIQGARDAIDKAISYKYAPLEAELDFYQKTLLPLAEQDLNREDQKRLQKRQEDLAERTRLLDNAKEDSKTGSALALVAQKNYPNDKQAQYNAQEAMREAQKPQPDLNRIFQLVGQYQNDPVATQSALLELQIKRQTLAKLKIETNQLTEDVKNVTAVEPYQAERNTRIIESVDDLMGRTSLQTVGFASLGRFLPASLPRNFATDLNTLKANIAFGELQAMRNASKTGGALGNVSDREITFLESALAGLDQGQSPDSFKKNLQKVKDSLDRWYGAKNALSEEDQLRAAGYTEEQIQQIKNS